MRREGTYFPIYPRLIQIQEGRRGAGSTCGQAVTGTPGAGCRNGSGSCSWGWLEERAGVGSCCVTARTRIRLKAEKRVLCVPEETQRRTALLQEEDAVWHKNPLGQGWRSTGSRSTVVTPPLLTAGLKICSFPHVRVPGEQLLCFQPALALSAPTCAWGSLRPLAAPLLLHPSAAPRALSHLLSTELQALLFCCIPRVGVGLNCKHLGGFFVR